MDEVDSLARSDQANPSEPATGRAGSAAAARVLASASRLFYERGIRASGVNTIAAEAGVTKVTLYAHFGSKDGLVTAHLQARNQRWREDLAQRLRSAREPAERLGAIFDGYEAWTAADDFRGCGFVNAAAELTDRDHPGRAVITAHKDDVQAHLIDIATEARCPDPTATAEEWFLLLEGAMLTASLRRDLSALTHARACALELLPSRAGT